MIDCGHANYFIAKIYLILFGSITHNPHEIIIKIKKNKPMFSFNENILINSNSIKINNTEAKIMVMFFSILIQKNKLNVLTLQ